MTDAMYEIEFQHRDGYLRAHVTGPEDTLEVSLAYWTEVAAECALHQVTRLLVVENLGTRATTSDMREMTEVLAQIGFRDVCLAYVDTLDTDDVLASAQIHARQYGLTGRVFRHEASAVEWLLQCPLPAHVGHARAPTVRADATGIDDPAFR